MHLTEFQLELRPHDVLANLVISDRDEDKELKYFGPGELPSGNSYQNHRVTFHFEADDDDSESTCVLLASHVTEISMAIYCPRRNASQGPTCTAIFDEYEPVIEQPANPKPLAPTTDDPFAKSDSCHAYRYESRDPPLAATRDLEAVKKGLTDLRVQFIEVSKYYPNVKIELDVQDFDVSRELQLITINNYRYAILKPENDDHSESAIVRTYETVTYDSLGDCTKMCNLDASCKSYSYCNDRLEKSAKCVLSSLDLRQNEVENQLVYAPILQDNRVILYDKGKKEGGKIGYSVDLKTGCNIYEKNFLSAFAQTDEIFRIESEIASSFITRPSATECARWVQGLEEQQTSFKSVMFAYCAGTNTCLADENLFVSLNETQKVDQDEQTSADAVTHELSCQIYRRRYQTYFHVSIMVIKHIQQEAAEEHWLKQTVLQFNTVEQCARACWDSFGHNCLSFDFCKPRDCTLNLLDQSKPLPSGDLSGELEHEIRSGCLHYERDLKWDQLRREHLLGHHNPLEPIQAQSTSSAGGRFLRNFLLTFVTGVLFIVGLAMGRIFNDWLENTAISARRTSIEPLRTSGRDSSGSGSLVSRSMQRVSSKFNIENEIYEDPDAILMEEFSQKQCANTDEPNKTSEDGLSTSIASKQSPSNSHRPINHIEIPNLMQV